MDEITFYPRYVATASWFKVTETLNYLCIGQAKYKFLEFRTSEVTSAGFSGTSTANIGLAVTLQVYSVPPLL